MGRKKSVFLHDKKRKLKHKKNIYHEEILFVKFICQSGTDHVERTRQQDTGNTQNGPKITFNELEHNYGTIQKGGDGNCEFTFTNDGNEPLILTGVRASCGCTTPTWTKEPVMPGKTGTIKVRYNTNNVGSFTKTITVTSNAVNASRSTLKIKGKVE